MSKNNVYALVNKGLALGRLGQYKEVITWFDKALVIDKNNVYALVNKGLALGRLGQYKEAITWFDKDSCH